MARKIFAFLIATLTLGSVALAQPRAETLQGKVVDQLGGVIVNAVVSLNGYGVRSSARTNQQGVFSFPNVPSGRYTLNVTASGFVPYDDKALYVTADIKPLTVELRVAGSSQEITVTTDIRMSIDADNSATMLVLRGKTLDALPDDPTALAAAMQLLTAKAGNPRGAQIFVNGFAAAMLPPKKSIREIRVNQNAFSAQYDQPGLGRVEILTKPGTNSFEGAIFSNFNDARLNSRNPFAVDRIASQTRLYGANLSGPVVRNRASFFVDFLRNENDDTALINATALDSSLNVVPFNQSLLTPYRRTTGSSRLDYHINESHTLVGRYAYSRSNSKNMGIGEFSLPSRSYQVNDSEHTLQLTETGVFGKTINEVRVQNVHDSRRQTADSNAPVLYVPDAFIAGGSEVGASLDRRNAWEVDNDTMWAPGNHAFKAGIRFRYVGLSSASPANFNGTYTFAGRVAPQLDANNNPIIVDGSWVPVPITTLESYRRTLVFQKQGLSPSEIRQLGGEPAQFTIAGGNALQAARQYDAGAYIQDDWKLAPNLTLSSGLRLEYQDNIRHRYDIGPRLGFAWTPSKSKDAKLVLRAGSGVFFDRFSENLVLQSIRFNGINQQQYVVSNPAILDRFPQTPSVETLRSFVLPAAITQIAPDMRAPYLLQGTFTAERTFPLDISTSFTYIHSNSVHLLRSRNVNAPLPVSGMRPNPNLGEVFQYESSGHSRQDQFITNITQRLGTRLTYYGTYILARAFSDTDGSSSFPANSYDLHSEWGPSLQDVRHTFYWGGWLTLPGRIDLTPTVIYRTGMPFNITTGRDTNGDSLYPERPAFATGSGGEGVVSTAYGAFDLNPESGQVLIPRNYGRGSNFAVTHLRVSRTFFTVPPSDAVASGRHSYSLTLSVQVQNLFNQSNPDVPVGNLSSPLFGRPYVSVGDFGFGTNPQGNRRIEAQIYFGF
jgi:Carboxypeptidase regulatory-like domain